MVFSQLYFVYQMTQIGSMFDIGTSLSILFSLIYVSYKLAYFYWRRQEIFKILNEVRNLLETLETNVNTKKWDKRLVQHFKFYISSIHLAILSTVLVFIIYFNEKKLGYNIWVPLNYKESNLKLVLSNIYAAFLALHNMTLAYTIDFLVLSVLGIMKGISIDFVEEFNSGKQNLHSMVQFLEKVRIITRTLNEKITMIFLPQVILMSLILCFASYSWTLVSCQLSF